MSSPHETPPLADQALAGLLRLAGRDTPDFVAIESGAPALATRFVADEAAAAALAAGATIAADLWRLRGGESQEVRVSTREAAAGLLSFLHQHFADAGRAPAMPGHDGRPGTAADGFMPTRDGRVIYLHPSFPPSIPRMMRVLGCPDEREAILAAVARRDALELENAIAEAGVCGAMVRSPEEWDATEQGRVLSARPVVEVVQIGDSPPQPLPYIGDAPLSGVRVLDLTRVLAGPACARALAQYGAEVLAITAPHLPSVPAFVSDTGHGKRSAFLDLTQEDDRIQLGDLVRTSDIFSQGYRGGALARLGFGPLALAQLRPGLIYTSINCYGHEGPWSQRPGWEQLAQTVSGMAHIHGGAAGPQLQPAAVTDYITGYLAAFGSLIALWRRALYGGSYLVRVSLVQTGMWIRALGVAGPERLAALSPLAPAELEGFKMTSETGYGPMTHLRPGVRLSATPAHWRRPTVPLGSHPPVWP